MWISLALGGKAGKKYAVSNTRMAVIDFLGIYLSDTIYLDAPLPR
jgi:hypothetical protein